MAVSSGASIVQTALALRQAHPDWPALRILDEAMVDSHDTAPDFECTNYDEYDDYLEPPSPFAELLREAFAPAISQADLLLMTGFDTDPANVARVMEIETHWLAAMRAFGKRYGLWPGSGDLSPELD